jgi:hypothetical protein
MSYTSRVGPQRSHTLQIDIQKPSRGVKIEFQRGGGGICTSLNGIKLDPFHVFGTTSRARFIP